MNFAEKYGLVGKGKPVKISKRTKGFIKTLYKRCWRAIEAGKDYVENEKGRFGNQT